MAIGLNNMKIIGSSVTLVSNFSVEEAKVQLQFVEDWSTGEDGRTLSLAVKEVVAVGGTGWKDGFLGTYKLREGKRCWRHFLESYRGMGWLMGSSQGMVIHHRWRFPEEENQGQLSESREGASVIGEVLLHWSWNRVSPKPRLWGRIGDEYPNLPPPTLLCLAGASPCFHPSRSQNTRKPGWCCPQGLAPEPKARTRR